MIDEKKTDKKKDLKSLLIYLALSFGLAWAWFLVFIKPGETWESIGSYKQSFVALGMLFPFIANMLTRKITKEGYSLKGDNPLMFGINLKDRKIILYIMAILLPWFYTELRIGLDLLLVSGLYDPGYYMELEISKRELIAFPVAAIVSGTFFSFAAFGEEAGWRGYMMPKLMKLMGKGKAVIVGGIIWGLWHAPLTCIGHNFGTDYPGFPYVGILEMCIMCTLMGMILTFVTVKSGSVWPAAIMHGVNNAGPGILAGFANYDRIGEGKMLFPGLFSMMISLLAAALICVFLEKFKMIKN